jgi:PAS domain S-box-containing protein
MVLNFPIPRITLRIEQKRQDQKPGNCRMPFPDKGVILLDLNGRVAYASTHFCDAVGVEHNAIAGRSWFDFVYPEDVDVARELIKKRPARKPFRFRLSRKDGSTAWVNVRAMPLQTSDGEIYAISATVTADAASEAITR